MKAKTIIISLWLLGISPVIARADWTSFRNGGDSTVAGLPEKWSPDTIAWQRELIGYGQSTPVIREQQVYVASVVGQMKEQCAIECFDLNNGNKLWQYDLDSAQKSPSNYMASRAAPTPVVDDEAVYVFFETGDLVAVDLSGKLLWHRVLSDEVGKFENNHGLGSSPAQNASNLFLNLEHKGPSYLMAIRKDSGQTSWKAKRPSGSSWSSPIVASADAQEQVIVSSAGTVVGYEPDTGAELWRVGGLDGNSVPSPTVQGNQLFVGARLPEFAEEGSNRSNCCLQLSIHPTTAPAIRWRADKALSDYASPVVAGQFVYFINKVGVLTCLATQTGKVHYRHRLSAPCWATPIVSGSHVYFFGKDGNTQLIEAGEEFKLLASSNLWDPSSPQKPLSYVEHSGSGEHGHGSSHGGSPRNESGKTRGRKPGSGMIGALMSGDKNGDGILQEAEIPTSFKGMLPRIDKNKDGTLDQQELEAMAKSFAERRAGAQSGARDPIVYGAAATTGNLVVRTGTRLYCIQN